MKQFTAPSIEELQPMFPNHHIQSFIAQGGMGAVYLANQISLDRPVAIKILPREFGLDEEYRASFATEAKGMARLNHSNLVAIYDFGQVDGMLFIIMEYIPGRSLYTVANELAVEQIEAANLIAEMCHGLAHAHSAGLLHRDIKPANVLIDDDAQPKIVDFGLVRPMSEFQTEGEVFGTPGYTAPEVLNDPLKVDQRSDIYSMGIMLYELLTAQLPGDPFVTASELSQSDKRFDHIIAKAINPDPNLRYHTAGQMAAALEDLKKSFEDVPGGLKLVAANTDSGLNTMLGVSPAQGQALAPISTSTFAGPKTTNSLGANSAVLSPVSLQSNPSRGVGKLIAILTLCFVIVGAVTVYFINSNRKKFTQVVTERAKDSQTETDVSKGAVNGEQNIIFAKKSVWSYDDSGKDHGTSDIVSGSADYDVSNWKHPEFDFSGWSSGKGVFGFGDIGRKAPDTQVGKESASGANALTSYFRKEFTITNIDDVNSVNASVLADDGVIIYLNGQEIHRSNLKGVVGHSDLANKTVGQKAERVYRDFTIEPANLSEGLNFLAVELHQSHKDSSDLGFDMNLSVSRVTE